MSTTTLEAVPTTRATALRRYRLAVLLLGLALAAMIATILYLTVGSPPAADHATFPPPAGDSTSQVDGCFRPAVPC